MPSSPLFDVSFRQLIVDHLLTAVRATEMCDDPFPHIVINGLFPNWLYAQLLDSLPRYSDFEPIDAPGSARTNGRGHQRRYRLEQIFMNRLPNGPREFWYAMRSALGSVEFKQAVFERLSSALVERFDCESAEVRSLPGFARPEILHETRAERIRPHADALNHVVSLQISLPEDNRHRFPGIELYRRSLRPAAMLRSPRGFEVVRSIPFDPNSAYAFVVLNSTRRKSWHGRSTSAEGFAVRNSIVNTWYERAEDANEEIIAENAMQRDNRHAA